MNLKSNIRRFETCPESGPPICPKRVPDGRAFFQTFFANFEKRCSGNALWAFPASYPLEVVKELVISTFLKDLKGIEILKSRAIFSR